MFLRNCWYVAAWGNEVKRLALMRRILLGEPVVLYRRGDGRPVALEDRWMNLVFTPPAFMRLDIGAALAGTGARAVNGSKGVTTRNLNAITPETDRSTHYFWVQARRLVESLIAAEKNGTPRRLAPLPLTP